MAIYLPTPGFKGRTFKLCVLTRWDLNFCVCSSPLWGTIGKLIPLEPKLTPDEATQISYKGLMLISINSVFKKRKKPGRLALNDWKKVQRSSRIVYPCLSSFTSRAARNSRKKPKLSGDDWKKNTPKYSHDYRMQQSYQFLVVVSSYSELHWAFHQESILSKDICDEGLSVS